MKKTNILHPIGWTIHLLIKLFGGIEKTQKNPLGFMAFSFFIPILSIIGIILITKGLLGE